MEGRQKTKVLLTGASGRIGSAFFDYARDRYSFRLADRPGSGIAPLESSDHEMLAFDLSDAGACRRACEGTGVVIHLATDPSPDAEFEGSVLPNNIVGTYNILRRNA